jgi:hypothetical protein
LKAELLADWMAAQMDSWMVVQLDVQKVAESVEMMDKSLVG